jgi:GT2 family glycosyltransferase
MRLAMVRKPGSTKGGIFSRIVASMETVTVVIPVLQASPALRRCLDRIQALEPPADEIVVVNDGADPLVREWCRRRGLLCFETKDRRGPAAARNLGVIEATGSIVLFNDSDVVPALDCVQQITDAFARNPHLAALFGSYDDAPADPGFFSQFKNLFHHFTHQKGRESAGTFWAGLGAIRRDAFFVVGGFDPSYVEPSVEDIELGYRLKARGLEIGLRRELQGKHLKQWTAWSTLRTDLFQRAIPWTELLWRHNGPKADLNLRPAELLNAALAVSLLPLAIAAARAGALNWALLILMSLWISLNRPLYSFFLRRRGPAFALAAVPWHWVYFLNSAFGLLLGTLRHWSRRAFAPAKFCEVPA